MHYSAVAPLILFCALGLYGLGACGKGSGLYADRSIPSVTPPASPDAAPRFVGRWAASAVQCEHPVVLDAHSLRTGGSECDFNEVETSPAGYAMVAECHSQAGLNPTRLIIVTPNQPQISILTISGGPFRAPAPLQRCPGS